MRPIESEEIREKRKKRNQLIVGVILIGLMVLSSAGYALINSFTGSSGNQITKYGLTYDGSYWSGNVQGYPISLTLDPDQAANISVILSDTTLSSYSGQLVYVASDDPFSFSQIATNLGPFTAGVREACFGPCDKNLPEKTCADNLIVINSTAAYPSVYRRDNCIFVEGNSDSTEALLYRLLGLIP